MKKCLSLFICIILLLSTFLISCADNNENSPSSWAEKYVNTASNMGLFDKSDSHIKYKEFINRESYCELAYDTLKNANKIEKYNSSNQLIFSDTSSTKILSLNQAGIIKGKGNNKFAPKDSLTREEAATILYRMAEFTGISEQIYKNQSNYKTYADDSSISDWAKDAVYALLNMGIMNGTDKGFEPKGSYTGEQAITTMVRIMELITSTISSNNTLTDNLNSIIPKDSNYMFSPLSIKMAFAIAANGANGDTKNEILEALSIENPDDYNQYSKELIDKYNQSDLLKLCIANSIWLNKSNTNQNFSNSFSNTIKNYYNGQAKSVTNDNAVKEINGWVNENTNGKITEIINNSNTDFISYLINAVYFKGKWQNQFDSSLTKKDTFTDKNGKTAETDFMNQTNWFKYSKTDNITILELPYLTYGNVNENDGSSAYDLSDMNVSMYLMMSDNAFNAEETLNKAEMNYNYISLSMPKFKFEYSVSLNDIIQKLGIKSAFNPFTADFTGMYTNGNTYLTNALHKTYISVDEEGTEAAAVTALEGAGSSLPPEPIVIKFNKPFTFVIKDNTNNEILFLGEYLFAE